MATIVFIALAALFGYSLGSYLAAGSSVDYQTRIRRLEYHLARIIHQYHNTRLTENTIAEAEKALADKDQ